MAPGALRRVVYRLHFVIGCLVGLGAFLGFSLAGMLYVLLFRKEAHRAPLLFARAFSAAMCGVLGWRIEARDLDRFALAAPALIVANHQSNLDIATYGSIFPPRTVAVGKKELSRVPLFGWFFAATGNILLDRDNRESAMKTIAEAAERIRSEKLSVWMFPEGHRNQGPELLPFKKGAFHLAIAAQVPVVVVVCEPIDGVLYARRALVRPGGVRMQVLPPIATVGRTAEDVDALLQEVRTLMQATRDDLAATARPRIR